MTRKNKDDTLRAWMTSYGRLVYSVAYKILRNEQDAEDVFQNTFSKAYFKLSKLTLHQNIKAWLCLTAKNDALNILASSWKKKTELVESPAVLVAESNDQVELNGLIRTLPSIYRSCIWLHYYAGYSTSEIAELTGVPPATVRTRLKRGREYLRSDIVNTNGSENYEY